MTIQSKDKPLFTKILIAPLMTLICLAIMILLDWLLPLALIVQLPFRLAGFLLLGVGLAISLTAERKFRRIGANLHPFNDPDRLVTDGPFRYSRNPMYLGLTILLAGVWVLLGSLSPLGIVAVFFLISDRWYIAYEEQRLAHIFGKSYEAYQARTPRWI